MNLKYDPATLKLDAYNYDEWYTEESDLSDKEELDDSPPLGGDEEGKEGQGLKIFPSNKLLTRLPVLLA